MNWVTNYQYGVMRQEDLLRESANDAGISKLLSPLVALVTWLATLIG